MSGFKKKRETKIADIITVIKRELYPKKTTKKGKALITLQVYLDDTLILLLIRSLPNHFSTMF